MPIAAVPKYLGENFKSASPGMRFGMYLQIWTSRHDQESDVQDRARKKSPEGREVANMLERQGMDATIQTLRRRQKRPLPDLWEKNESTARKSWEEIAALNPQDKKTMEALHARQAIVAKHILQEALYSVSTRAIAPFTTGLGNEHPLENGFAFLNPYGLPYLPGSGAKGVLRQAARELASGDWGERHGWNDAPCYILKLKGTPKSKDDTIPLSIIDVLFGKESQDGEKEHVRGALTFWDVIPQIAGDSLTVEVMTPHQAHYYQQKQADRKKEQADQQKVQADITSPHDSGQPIPIYFLTVPPDSQFTFHVVCDLAHLERLTADRLEGAPDLLAEGDMHWKRLLKAAFEHAFTWLGFGAKTAVGYGAMASQAQAKRLETALQQDEAKRLEAAPQQVEAEAWPGARIKFNHASKALIAEKGGKTATATAPKGEELLATLPEDTRKKLKTNQFVRATAYVVKSTLVKIEL